MGLLVNNKQHNLEMAKGVVFKTGHQLHLMFAIIVVHSLPSEPRDLYEKHKPNLSNNIQYFLLNK